MCFVCPRSEKAFKHKIQLYLADAYGVRVPNTDFWVTLDAVCRGREVTIQVPAINFETGTLADDPVELHNPYLGGPVVPPVQSGGYLYTSRGFLPKDIRPSGIIPLTYYAGSNNGNIIPFSYNGTYPPP